MKTSLKFQIYILLVVLAFVPSISSAQYKNGIAEVAQMYDALYSRYGQEAKLRSAMARSDCGEIYTSNSGGYSCAACGDQVVSDCAPARAYDVAIIDEESRRLPTQEESEKVGQAVGSLECNDPKLGWLVSTGYLVASNVLKVTAHSIYSSVKDPANPGGKKYVKNVDPVKDCIFSLRDPKNGGVLKTFSFEEHKECPNRSTSLEFKNCDWALFKLSERAPDSVKPLEILIGNPLRYIGQNVLTLGFHNGVTLNNVEQSAEIKLADIGKIVPKGSSSPLAQFPNLVQYTGDTNPMSSGQPILIKSKGKYYVIGSHRGEEITGTKVKGSFSESGHFNYGELNQSDLIDTIKTMVSPDELYRFETIKISQPRLNEIQTLSECIVRETEACRKDFVSFAVNYTLEFFNSDKLEQQRQLCADAVYPKCRAAIEAQNAGVSDQNNSAGDLAHQTRTPN